MAKVRDTASAFALRMAGGEMTPPCCTVIGPQVIAAVEPACPHGDDHNRRHSRTEQRSPRCVPPPAAGSAAPPSGPGAVSDTIGHTESGVGLAIASVEPVMLVRYRAGVTGQTARTVHLALMPGERVVGAVGTLCGALLDLKKIEVLSSLQGMPCTMCLFTQLSTTTGAMDAPVGSSGRRR